MALNATGILSYNGFTFDGSSRVNVSVRNVEDEAGRIVIRRDHTFTVVAVVSAPLTPGVIPCDAALENIRYKLSQSGMPFSFTGRGFGNDLSVNTGGLVKDIDFGPKPKVLEWRPMGDNKTSEIVWTVTVALPPCSLTEYRGVMALNYSATFGINEHGDTVRTISGYLLVAMSRNVTAPGSSGALPTIDSTLSDSADNYRREFNLRAPAGFKRTQQWSVSASKARLDFSITDTQIPSPNAYPAYVTAISGSHDVSWRRVEGSMLKWFSTISMNIQPHAGISGTYAWNLFASIVAQRMAISNSRNAKPHILSLDVGEDLFGRACRFSCRYVILSCWRQLVEDTGLWVNLGTTWAAWRTSMEDGFVHDPYGMMQLSVGAGDDKIINICSEASSDPGDGGQGQQQMSPTLYSLCNTLPSPQNSYMEFENKVTVLRSTPAVRSSALEEAEVRPEENADMTREDPFNFGVQRPSNPDKISVGGKGRYRLLMYGHAKRLGYPVPRPGLDLLDMGDETDKPVEVKALFRQHSVKNGMCLPIYEAAWAIEYLLTTVPQQVRAQGNPADCVAYLQSKVPPAEEGTPAPEEPESPGSPAGGGSGGGFGQ